MRLQKLYFLLLRFLYRGVTDVCSPALNKLARPTALSTGATRGNSVASTHVKSIITAEKSTSLVALGIYITCFCFEGVHTAVTEL
jgi:hypothetical protein